MKIQSANRQRAFTVLEALLVGITLVLLLAISLAVFAPARRGGQMINCVNNLKEIGIAFRIWEGDNGDRYPMNVAVTNGGALEWVAAGKVAACFNVVSNELATPKILVCPEDKQHDYATNFGGEFTAANVSYFLALSMTNDATDTVVSGDGNLVQNGRPVSSGILKLGKNTTTWTRKRHQGCGNILAPDGAVYTAVSLGYPALTNSFSATNLVAVP